VYLVFYVKIIPFKQIVSKFTLIYNKTEKFKTEKYKN